LVWKQKPVWTPWHRKYDHVAYYKHTEYKYIPYWVSYVRKGVLLKLIKWATGQGGHNCSVLCFSVTAGLRDVMSNL